jgi:uncharacterized protein (UPF0332 family)
VTPEEHRFVEKAQRLLANADVMLGAGLSEDAARAAYLAGFHAAQAVIFRHTGKASKTHHGVQREFLRLTKDAPGLDPDVRAFLSRAYNLKAIADYETGPNSTISIERARDAVSKGKVFVAALVGLLG